MPVITGYGGFRVVDRLPGWVMQAISALRAGAWISLVVVGSLLMSSGSGVSAWAARRRYTGGRCMGRRQRRALSAGSV